LRDATENDAAAFESVLLGKAPQNLLDALVLDPEDLIRFGFSEQPFVVLDPSGIPSGYRARKQSTVNQSLNILHSMYEFWMIPDPESRVAYVGANPVRRLKRSTVRAQRQVNRVFQVDVLQAMLACTERIAATTESPSEKSRAIRAQWILALLFGLWARRSEISFFAHEQLCF